MFFLSGRDGWRRNLNGLVYKSYEVYYFMKGWLKTGILAVAVYVIVFTFNHFFLSQIPDNIVIRIVNAPVYFLLQLFGIVSAGYIFWIGVFAYFLLGVILFFITQGLDNLTKRFNVLKEDDGPEVTKKSMGFGQK